MMKAAMYSRAKVYLRHLLLIFALFVYIDFL